MNKNKNHLKSQMIQDLKVLFIKVINKKNIYLGKEQDQERKV
jgi:hypothetical protein